MTSVAAPLDLSPVSPQMSSFLSPGMSPVLNFSSAPPSPMLSPALGGFDNKQSWFSNLFNWKPAVSHPSGPHLSQTFD